MTTCSLGGVHFCLPARAWRDRWHSFTVYQASSAVEGCPQQKGKQITIEEFSLVHNANRVKADCEASRSIWKLVKPGKRTCNRLRRNTGISYSSPASVIFGSCNPWETCLGKREALETGRKKCKTSPCCPWRVSGQTPSLSSIKLSAHLSVLYPGAGLQGRANVWPCIHFQLTGGPRKPCQIANSLAGDLAANADRAAILQHVWKNGSLPKTAQGRSPGKTVIRGYLCVLH